MARRVIKKQIIGRRGTEKFFIKIFEAEVFFTSIAE
jgi:hypothetical protein